MSQNGKIAGGLIWKLLERFGVLGGQFVMQIILARIMGPNLYGVLALLTIFTALANSYIQHGFNLALVQNKDVSDADYSSVFWVNLLVSGGIYVLLFLAAPLIADAYDMPELVAPFRVLCLMLLPGAVNSIQIAKLRRSLNFKTVFICNFLAVILSGGVSIFMAYMGAGLWALVVQTLLQIAVASIAMWFAVDLKLRFQIDWQRIRVLFSFGWKLMLSNFIDVLYQDIRAAVIGLKYSSGTLGNYDQGKKFPQFINSVVNTSVQSVLLPAMSKEQSDKSKVKLLMRNSVMLSSYIIFPVMAGLAGVAEPMVRLLLGEAWLGCVPYLQIYCFTFAFYPVHTSNLQAINAMGRSDVFLYLELIKKGVGAMTLAVAILCFDSPIAIAMTGVVGVFTNTLINAFPNRKLIGYSYLEQMKDILPAFLVAAVMFGAVLCVQLLELPVLVTIGLQVIVGIGVYVGISAALRLKPFQMVVQAGKKFLHKKQK